MVLNHDPLLKRESMEWSHLHRSHHKKSKGEPFGNYYFLRTEGILMNGFKERNMVANKGNYVLLLYKLKKNFLGSLEERSGSSIAMLLCCSFTKLIHLPHSLDQAPSQWLLQYLFSILKSDLQRVKGLEWCKVNRFLAFPRHKNYFYKWFQDL